MHVSGQRTFHAPLVVAIPLPLHVQSRVIGRGTFFCDRGWNDADVVQFDAGNAPTVARLADASIVAWGWNDDEVWGMPFSRAERRARKSRREVGTRSRSSSTAPFSTSLRTATDGLAVVRSP